MICALLYILGIAIFIGGTMFFAFAGAIGFITNPDVRKNVVLYFFLGWLSLLPEVIYLFMVLKRFIVWE